MRATLDGWFQHIPPHARQSIRDRFISSDPGHHLGALLEIYVHELLRRQDYKIDLDAGRDRTDERRPDFLLSTTRSSSFYLETTAVLGDDVLGDRANRPLAAAVYDAINTVNAPAWFVSADIEAFGLKTPGRAQIRAPIEQWLASLNPDLVLQSSHERVPFHRLAFDGWDISLWAFPVSPEHRGEPDHRVLGSHAEGMNILDDAAPIRSKLKKKASRYGEMDRPYIVWLLCAGDFAEDRDIADALLGKTSLRMHVATGHTDFVRDPDGFWWGPKGAQNTRVSGVITVPRLNWGSITAVEPTLWLNPWAQRPFTGSMPWRTERISTDGRFNTTAASHSAADVLGLSPRWPVQQP